MAFKRNQTRKPRTADTQAFTNVPVPYDGRGDFGNNIIPVFNPQHFENSLVVGIPKRTVSYPGTAEDQNFNIPSGKVVLQVNAA